MMRSIGSETSNYDFASRDFRSTQVESGNYNSEAQPFSTTQSFRFLKKMPDSIWVNNCLIAQNMLGCVLSLLLMNH